MITCLNPRDPHPVPATAAQQLVCPESNCGFLLDGASISGWQVRSLLRAGPVADLYLATPLDAALSNPPNKLVKVLRALAPEPIAYVQQRVQQLLALRHPHIHPLEGAGWMSEGSMLYLLSAYEAQGSLARFPGAGTGLPPLAVASIVRQLAQALQFAHEQELVHGRMKPENCLLVAPATVQISDFMYDLLAPAARLGTATVAAPEQMHSRPEPASDQYTLAILTYFLLTAQLPFDGSGVAPQTTATPRPIRDLRPDLPPATDQTLRRALNWQPYQRFPSVLEFALALQSALESTSGVSGSATFTPTPTPLPGLASISPPYLIPSAWPSRASSLGSTPPVLPVSSVGSMASTPAEHSHDSVPLLRYSFPSPPVSATSLCLLPGHTAGVTLVRWAPNSSLLASAGPDRSVRLWRIQQRIGTPLGTIGEHEGEVRAMSWSPDGKLLASAAADAAIRMWEISSASSPSATARAAWWGHDGGVVGLDWSPDGAHLASGGTDRTIRLWNRQGTAIATWQAHGRGGVTALAWSPNGRILASGGADRQIQLRNATSGEIVLTCEGLSDEVRHLAWRSDGAILASSCRKKDPTVTLWNTQTGRQMASLAGHTGEIVGFCWSPDGTWLVTAATDHTMRFWNGQQPLGQPIGQPVYSQSMPLSLDVLPQHSLIALGLDDMLIRVFQLIH